MDEIVTDSIYFLQVFVELPERKGGRKLGKCPVSEFTPPLCCSSNQNGKASGGSPPFFSVSTPRIAEKLKQERSRAIKTPPLSKNIFAGFFEITLSSL